MANAGRARRATCKGLFVRLGAIDVAFGDIGAADADLADLPAGQLLIPVTQNCHLHAALCPAYRACKMSKSLCQLIMHTSIYLEGLQSSDSIYTALLRARSVPKQVVNQELLGRRSLSVGRAGANLVCGAHAWEEDLMSSGGKPLSWHTPALTPCCELSACARVRRADFLLGHECGFWLLRSPRPTSRTGTLKVASSLCRVGAARDEEQLRMNLRGGGLCLG